MKSFITKYGLAGLMVSGISFLTASCSKQKVVDAAYPEQTIYMSTAASATLAAGSNGFYNINTPAIPGQVYRYQVDSTAGKFNIELGVVRTGVTLDGEVPVNIGVNTDTINTLITAGRLPATALSLPASAYTLPATASVATGAQNTVFNLAVDLPFLVANPGKQYVVGVGVFTSKAGIRVNPTLATTVVVIDTRFILPLANFTSVADAANPKKINFTNTSMWGVTYSWNFGDGSPAETTLGVSHIYAAAGTYNVTLTVFGVTGTSNKSVKTTAVVVL